MISATRLDNLTHLNNHVRVEANSLLRSLSNIVEIDHIDDLRYDKISDDGRFILFTNQLQGSPQYAEYRIPVSALQDPEAFLDNTALLEG